jgi:hypothetical protein
LTQPNSELDLVTASCSETPRISDMKPRNVPAGFQSAPPYRCPTHASLDSDSDAASLGLR